MSMPDLENMATVACCDKGTTGAAYAQTLPEKIPGDEDARLFLATLDFTQMKEIVVEETGLTLDEIEVAEARYKKWLYLRRIHPGELMPPTKDIDMMWHYHLLDTHSYFRSTAAGLGYFLHHYPYFGRRGKADKAKLMTAFENTKRRWKDEYGSELDGALPARQA